MNNVDNQYIELLRYVLANGTKKADRTGVGTMSIFGNQMRFDMSEGFPLLTTKKLYTKAIIHELLWFLKGGDNIKYLVDNGVNIWNEWPWQNYCKERTARESALKIVEAGSFELDLHKKRLDEHPALTLVEFADKIRNDAEFAKVWGELGPVYGKQWVAWDSYKIVDGETHYQSINQIDSVINDLRHNPDSRRIMVNAWNVGQVPDMKLPPCHWAFQLWTRELNVAERCKIYDSKNGLLRPQWDLYIASFGIDSAVEMLDKADIPKRSVSLMFQMRSVDLGLGWSFDVASYGILLSMIAQCVGMVPHELIITTGDTHIYLNHIEALKTQLDRVPFDLPTLSLNPNIKNIYDFKYEDIKVENYQAHPSIKMDVAI